MVKYSKSDPISFSYTGCWLLNTNQHPVHIAASPYFSVHFCFCVNLTFVWQDSDFLFAMWAANRLSISGKMSC